MPCPELKRKHAPSTKTNHRLVLDIDETMVYTVGAPDDDLKELLTPGKYLDVRKRLYVITLSDGSHMWGVKRPYLSEFLKFAQDYFDEVIVWTAGTEDYADAIVGVVFDPSEGIRPPAQVYSRKDCLRHGGADTKPLSKIFDGERSATNTLMLDDRADYMQFNLDNGIVVPKYSPRSDVESIRQCEFTLPTIMDWLETPDVRKSKDVRTLDKSRIVFSGGGGVGEESKEG